MKTYDVMKMLNIITHVFEGIYLTQSAKNVFGRLEKRTNAFA